jgi:hypothetical protein
MNRKFFRFVSVAAVVLAINVAMLPTAEARGLSGSHTAVTSTTDLWSAAIAWLTNLLPGGNTGHAAGLNHRSSASSITGTGTGTVDTRMRPNTGSCIDPNGKCNV